MHGSSCPTRSNEVKTSKAEQKSIETKWKGSPATDYDNWSIKEQWISMDNKDT